MRGKWLIIILLLLIYSSKSFSTECSSPVCSLYGGTFFQPIYYINETFAYTQDTDIANYPFWTALTAADATAKVATDGTVTVLDMYDNSNVNQLITNFTFPVPITSKGTIEMRIRLTDPAVSGRNRVYIDFKENGTAAIPTELTLWGDQGSPDEWVFSYSGGSAYGYFTVSTYHLFRMDFDVDADTVTYYLDGALLDGGAKSLSTAVSKIDYIQFNARFSDGYGYHIYIDYINMTWTGIPQGYSGVNYPCCGNSGASDNFYNGTISNTTSFCYQGTPKFQSIDLNKTLCQYYGYNWINSGIVEGFNSYTENQQIRGVNGWNTWTTAADCDFTKVTVSGKSLGHLVQGNPSTLLGTISYTFPTSKVFSSSQDWVSFKYKSVSNSGCGRPLVNIYRGGTTIINLYLFSNYFSTNNGGTLNVVKSFSAGDMVNIRVAYYNNTYHKIFVSVNGGLETEHGPYGNSVSLPTWSGGSISGISLSHGWAGCLHDSYFGDIANSWADSSIGLAEGYPACCGDDGASDSFYNSTLGTTTTFCHQGSYTNTSSIDMNKTLCNYYGYNWMDANISYGADYISNGLVRFRIPNNIYRYVDAMISGVYSQTWGIFDWGQGSVASFHDEYPENVSVSGNDYSAQVTWKLVDRTGTAPYGSGAWRTYKASVYAGQPYVKVEITGSYGVTVSSWYIINNPIVDYAFNSSSYVYKDRPSGCVYILPSGENKYTGFYDSTTSRQNFILWDTTAQVCAYHSAVGNKFMEFIRGANTFYIYSVYNESVSSLESARANIDNYLSSPASCCGDDGATDNFYNASIASTNFFCSQGSTSNQWIDSNQSVCESFGYSWIESRNGLAAYYNLDESSGTSINDLSNNGNTGTLYGGEGRINGRSGNALIFTNSSTYITVPHSDSLNISSNITVSLWIKTSMDCSGGWRGILHKKSDPNDGSSYLVRTSSGNIYFTIFGVDNSNNHAYLACSNINNNQWHHIVGLYNKTHISLYVDGQIRSISSKPNINIKTNTEPLRISYNFVGSLDDVQVFNKALTDSEIKAIYNYNIHSCCGDDGLNDTFYNGSIGTTSNLCVQGTSYFEPLDSSQSLCTNFGYSWVSNAYSLADYSFTSEANGTTSPQDWFGWGGAEPSHGYIIDGIGGRSKVYELFDNDPVPDSDKALSNVFAEEERVSSGNFSYYFRMQDPDGPADAFFLTHMLRPAGSSVVLAAGKITAFGVNSQLVCIENFASGLTVVGSISADAWHKVNVEFDTSLSTVQVTLDNNDPVTCGLYDSWEEATLSNILFGTGGMLASGTPDHYVWLDDFDFDWTHQHSCCGDDSINDSFYNSTSMCVNGTLYHCGTYDGICPEQIGFPISCFSDPDCGAYEENTYNLCVNASTTWNWFSTYKSGASPYCCGNNGTSDDWLSMTGCCYNGEALQEGSFQNSLYCLSGNLFDCNNQISDAGEIDTNVITGQVKGNYYCLSNNSWGSYYYEDSEFNINVISGVLVSGQTYTGAVNFTLSNPLNEHQTYNLRLSYDRGYSHFTASEKNEQTLTIPPLSSVTSYIDIFPVITGEMSFTLTMTNVNNPDDSDILQFSVMVVPTQSESSGIYSFDEVTIFELLVKFLNQFFLR